MGIIKIGKVQFIRQSQNDFQSMVPILTLLLLLTHQFAKSGIVKVLNFCQFNGTLNLLCPVTNECKHFFFFFFLFRAAPTAHGSSQAGSQIGAAAAGLHHSHSNAGFEPHLRPTLQLKARLDP